MTNLKIAGLHVDPRDLGSEMLVTGVRPYYTYENGNRTDKVEGYKYESVLPMRSYEKLDIKVPGAKRIEVPAGQYVAVRYDGLAVKLYFDNSNRVRLTAKAADVHALSGDKPSKT